MLNSILSGSQLLSATGEGMKLGFTTKLLPEAFAMMGKGMLGIFIALFVIYLACIGLKKAFPPKEEEQQ